MLVKLAVTVPGLICLLGALAYGLAGGKAQELGRIAFGVGLLGVVLYVVR